ncbi:MAG: hypothetical protein AAGD96_26550 [Chloroflexota bacterium]
MTELTSAAISVPNTKDGIHEIRNELMIKYLAANETKSENRMKGYNFGSRTS